MAIPSFAPPGFATLLNYTPDQQVAILRAYGLSTDPQYNRYFYPHQPLTAALILQDAQREIFTTRRVAFLLSSATPIAIVLEFTANQNCDEKLLVRQRYTQIKVRVLGIRSNHWQSKAILDILKTVLPKICMTTQFEINFTAADRPIAPAVILIQDVLTMLFRWETDAPKPEEYQRQHRNRCIQAVLMRNSQLDIKHLPLADLLALLAQSKRENWCDYLMRKAKDSLVLAYQYSWMSLPQYIVQSLIKTESKNQAPSVTLGTALGLGLQCWLDPADLLRTFILVNIVQAWQQVFTIIPMKCSSVTSLRLGQVTLSLIEALLTDSYTPLILAAGSIGGSVVAVTLAQNISPNRNHQPALYLIALSGSQCGQWSTKLLCMLLFQKQSDAQSPAIVAPSFCYSSSLWSNNSIVIDNKEVLCLKDNFPHPFC